MFTVRYELGLDIKQSGFPLQMVKVDLGQVR